MAASPNEDVLAPGARPSSRIISRQACDGCRLRKRRCTFKGNDGINWNNAGIDADTRCRNCEKAGSQCTFLLPLKTRGPKMRSDRQYMTVQSPTSGGRSSWDGDMIDRQSPLSQQSPSNANATAERTTFLAEPSIRKPPPLTHDRCYATDILLPRDIVRFILGDYVTYVYPLVPVIHIPSFETNFDREHDAQNQDFLSLIISLCALTVGLLPSRFWEYQKFKSKGSFTFNTRIEMTHHCYKLNQGFRDTEYFDTVNHQKWASSYLLGIALHQIGNTNLWRMLEVESMQLLRLLEVQHISTYASLDAIEAQLRKKAFWLMFYSYAHHKQNLRNERLTFLDPLTLRELNLEDLMPSPVDDQYISSGGILPCPEEIAANSLAAGFNIHSRVFCTALGYSSISVSQFCDCPRAEGPEIRLAKLKDQLRQLKYMLDTVHPTYRPWNQLNSSRISVPDHNTVEFIQREAIRANIHVTHLWLQSRILDQIDAITSKQSGPPISSPESVTQRVSDSSCSPTMPNETPDSVLWDERENLCHQLLHTLHSFSQTGLEPNGLSLVYKVRDVAATLLACPYAAHEERAQRAREYLGEFSNVLSMLDASEKVNTTSLQSWIDTSRDKAISTPMSED